MSLNKTKEFINLLPLSVDLLILGLDHLQKLSFEIIKIGLPAKDEVLGIRESALVEIFNTLQQKQ